MKTAKSRNVISRRLLSWPGSVLGLRYSVKVRFSISFWAQGHSPRAPEDCNAAHARRRAPLPGKNRDEPPPRRRTPSKWEHSGTRREAAAKSGSCRTSAALEPRISFWPSLLDDGKKIFDFGIEPRKLHLQHRLARMQHHVYWTLQTSQSPPHGRTQPPADPIAFHCSTQRLAHGKPDARTSIIFAIAVKHSQVPRKMLPSLLIDRL